MPEHFDLEPAVQGGVVSDRDAWPARRTAVRGLAFRVTGQPAEGARGAFDHIARVGAPRWSTPTTPPRGKPLQIRRCYEITVIFQPRRCRCYAAAAPGMYPRRRRRQKRPQDERER